MARSSGTFQKGQKVPGQGKRGPDKVTADARAAIAAFVDANAHRLVGWLDKVADGIPDTKDPDNPDKCKWLVRPDPSKAFELYQSVVEYHIPKLARTESTVQHSGKIEFGWKE